MYSNEDLALFKKKGFTINKQGRLDKFSIDIDKARLYCIDFEVFKWDWLCVIIDVEAYNSGEYNPLVIINDRDKLRDFYVEHCDKDILIGYNIKSYDIHILRTILNDSKSIYKCSEFIVGGGTGYLYDPDGSQNWPIHVYDVLDKFHGLKELEAFMGSSIVESNVDFRLDRKLTQTEIDETVFYCTHDVEQTIEVFNRKQNDWDAAKSLVTTFGLPSNYISKTKSQMSAAILGCDEKLATRRAELSKAHSGDEWEIEIVDTLDIKKYSRAVDFFKSGLHEDYCSSLTMDICGVPHNLGFGGIHGCPEKPLRRKGCILHVDVNSYYPSIMIVYGLLSRNTPDGKYRQHIGTPLAESNEYVKIYKKRLQLKHEGKKKEQAPYKIVLNSTYGITKDQYSSAFDPKQANNICINGQLMLIDLLEHLEGHCELIQSNTDGIIVYLPDPKEEETVLTICHEWEDRTGMGLGIDHISEIIQKDVNNYVCMFINGEVECKGAYVKDLNELDYDLPIVNEALRNYIIKGKPVAETINECNELIKFQKIVKVSSHYVCGMHNGQPINNKTFRVFASNSIKDGPLYKVNHEMATEKFANTPASCFIMNDSVRQVRIPKKLDKNWYIKLANERLEQFGLSQKPKARTLF